MPINLKQAIYTSADTSEARGYQFIAKSKGIVSQDLEKIKSQSLPSETIPPEFDFESSIHFYHLPSNDICITRLKNIGEGFDGRPNTICAHSLIMGLEEFKMMKCNILYLIDYFTHDTTKRGVLEDIQISTIPAAPETSLHMIRDKIKTYELLQSLLSGILQRKKMVLNMEIQKEEVELIQNILSLFPTEVRCNISFNSLDFDATSSDLTVIPPESRRGTSFQDSEVITVDLINQSIKGTLQDLELSKFMAQAIMEDDTERINKVNTFIKEYEPNLDNLNLLYKYWDKSQSASNLESNKSKIQNHIDSGNIINNISKKRARYHYDKAISLAIESQVGEKLGVIFNRYFDLLKKDQEISSLAERYEDILIQIFDEWDIGPFYDFCIKMDITSPDRRGYLLPVYKSNIHEKLIKEENISGEAGKKKLDLILRFVNITREMRDYFKINEESCRKGYDLAGNEHPDLAVEFLRSYERLLSFVKDKEKKLEKTEYIARRYDELHALEDLYRLLNSLIKLYLETGKRKQAQRKLSVFCSNEELNPDFVVDKLKGYLHIYKEERPIMDYHYLMTKLMHQDGLDIKVERYLENKILKTNKDLVARSLNRNESKQVYKSYEKILERSSGENGRNKEVKKGLKSLYKKNYPVDSFSNLKEYINILKLYNRYYEDEGLPWWLKRNMKKIIKEYFKKEQVETELKTYIKKVYKNSAVDSAIREDLEDLLEYYEKRLKKARKDGTFNRFIG